MTITRKCGIQKNHLCKKKHEALYELEITILGGILHFLEEHGGKLITFFKYDYNLY